MREMRDEVRERERGTDVCVSKRGEKYLRERAPEDQQEGGESQYEHLEACQREREGEREREREST
jgi:hypothetical protein